MLFLLIGGILAIFFIFQIIGYGIMGFFYNFWLVDVAIMWYLSLPFVENHIGTLSNVSKVIYFVVIGAITWAIYRWFTPGAAAIGIFTTFLIGKEFYHDYGLGLAFWIPMVIVVFLQLASFGNIRGEFKEEKEAFREEMKDINPFDI